ncbi:hypothetical protein IQ07DRAFT_582908 [Pyrenochaeta sp. DS3sAY3a]|nr:hypothetical protein IQ07DRAFT_582908 [Pyrenochaeta sp. DS3sAY3a]
MLYSTIAGTALLLLASAASAQSVVPAPTTEDVFTIQTSVPGTFSTPCYEVCIQEPCFACAQPSSPLNRSSTALLMDPGSSTEGFMSIPAGETPLPTSESVVSIITDPLLSTETGVMSIPAGETPLSTGSLEPTPAPSTPSLNPSAVSSAPPQQSTNAAARAVKDDGSSFVVALVGAAFALL